jgi:hypothetical protein
VAEGFAEQPSGGDGLQVEVLRLRNGERIARPGQPWQCLLVVATGAISLERSDCSEADFQVATVMVTIPPGVDFRLTAHDSPTRVVLIRVGDA